MKKSILIFTALMLLSAGAAWAQRSHYAGTVAFDDPGGKKEGNTVVLNTQLNLNQLKLNTQQMVWLTPVLRSADRAHSQEFAPYVILGKTRSKAVQRAERLHGLTLSPEPQALLVYRKKGNESLPITLVTQYEPWMRQAELVFLENVTGCRDKTLAQNEYRVIGNVLPPAFVPTYTVAYATPPVEAVKVRSESYSARINFPVNRYDIRRHYMGNAAVLDEVDRIIRELKDDSNLTISDFHVTGYASPEGDAASNLTLSERRAKSFVEYIRTAHVIPTEQIKVDWKGDDWDGLQKEIQASGFFAKDRVLAILNGTTDPAQRKNQLKALGADYQTLLRDYYPQLRRNDYTISYVARAFSVEEARTLIHTKPQQLSLNEMFLVANSYPKGSKEFNEVFAVAAKTYPQDPYARLNNAASQIEGGATDAVLMQLQGIEIPEAWNNIGLIYARLKDYTRAREFFTRAANTGDAIARENLNQLNRWYQD
jgi:outer membrane protein OmpA-like peptidoglycan-associated protein